MNWETFHEEIRKSEIQDSIANEKEGAMIPLHQAFVLPVYTHRRFSDVDFSSFTYDQVKLAFDQGIILCPADDEEEAENNQNNLIVQLNRTADLKYHLKNLSSSTSKKKRFI